MSHTKIFAFRTGLYKKLWSHNEAKYSKKTDNDFLVIQIFQKKKTAKIWRISALESKLYTPSTPNNSNETHTFICLGRTGRFGQR